MGEIIKFEHREDPTKVIKSALRWYKLADEFRTLESDEAVRRDESLSVIERMAQRGDPIAQKVVRKVLRPSSTLDETTKIRGINRMLANMGSTYRSSMLPPESSVIPGKSGQQLADAIKNHGGNATLGSVRLSRFSS